jgi:hypothetical protein
MQLWNCAQFDAASEFPPQKSSRTVQPRARSIRLCGIANQREKNFRMAIVGSHFDIRERDHANTRVLDFEPDQVGKLALDLLGHAQGA